MEIISYLPVQFLTGRWTTVASDITNLEYMTPWCSFYICRLRTTELTVPALFKWADGFVDSDFDEALVHLCYTQSLET